MNNIKRILAIVLYHLGDVISKNGLDHWDWAANLYQWSMLKSSNFDIKEEIWNEV